MGAVGLWPPVLIVDPCERFACVFGTGGCVQGGDSLVLAAWTVLAVAPLGFDRTLCVAGFDPSSLPDGAPGYVDCDEELLSFLDAPNPCSDDVAEGCLVVNPSFACDPVDAAAESLGAIESLYRN